MPLSMETTDINPTLIGNILLQRGFADWFLYLFRVINNTKFIVENVHKEMFREVHNIINGTDTRVCINIPPRSAKTTYLTWLCVFSMLINPKSQIIYTSFNQDLLKQVAENIASIICHPVFKAMYPTFGQCNMEEFDDDPINQFWHDYIVQQTGKPTFSSRKITTPSGGVILFASIGSSITGFGAGIRSAKGFSGFLGIDDGEKPQDIRSAVMRQKTQTYFAETLLSRLNNPDTPIINIQQRLHLDDLSAFLYKTYNFKPFVFPLIDDTGNCTIPSQYTPERIDELKINNYVFQAQYQQAPIVLGGGVFKDSWWKYYDKIDDTSYRRIFITADTASKTKEWNDFTAIGVWGVTGNNQLRLLDYIHARMEIPELQETFVALWEKWKGGINSCRCSAVYIEDKASGTQVIQQLRRKGGIPIMPVTPKTDKLTRALDAVPQIAAGNVFLPESPNNPLSAEILKDLSAFAADMSHKFDDGVDCLLYAVDAAYNQRGYF